MNELEIFKGMLTRAGILFKEEDTEIGGTSILLEAGTQNVDGYFGFRTCFYFNPDGKMLEASIYE